MEHGNVMRSSYRPGWVARGAGVAVILLLDAFLASRVAAHPGEPLAPHDLWSAWTLDPWVLAGIALSVGLYVRGVRRLWGKAGTGRGIRRWQVWCYAGGVAALFAALVSPLDALGGVLFSAHMLQHVVLMLVAAPLLVLGMPLIPFLWALPMRWRQRLGGWARNPDLRGIWYVFTYPAVAWLLHAGAIWVWHVPALYQATLYSEAVHIVQHLSFFGTALLFWWVALESSRRRRRAFGFGVLYVFTTAVHSSILGALLTFSLVLWYPAYAPTTAAWGLTPLEDQQLGGLVMWVPAGIVYVVAALMLLAAGLGLTEREARRREGYGGQTLWSARR
ncbi:cytochrome c oxidase assembly protein [soil metagenome]